MLLHSLIYRNRTRYLTWIKFVYLPILWLIFYFHYVVNVEGFLKEAFGVNIFKPINRRFGIFDYNPAFPHLLFQIFTLFYGSLVCYLFADYDLNKHKRKDLKELRMKRRQSKMERRFSENSRHSIKKSSSFGESGTLFGDSNKEEPIYTYQIISRLILKNIDIILMIILYIAGVNRIDIYHMILLLVFTAFVIWPDKLRRNFKWLLYFMLFIVTMK